MKGVWMLVVTFHCKIDHVDTTAASSLRRSARKYTEDRKKDGKYWSDGGKENKDRRRGYYQFHYGFYPEMIGT